MRTTITLDDDVAALIESERARTGELFPAAVNRLLRRSARTGPSWPMVATPHHVLGRQPLPWVELVPLRVSGRPS